MNMAEMMKETANVTLTENGAVTLRTTGSDCLDLFSTIGALRKADENDIIERFIRAYCESPDTAMKILFYARDVRGGLGERRTFRILLRWLADNHSASVIKNIQYIPEFGRYDDLLELSGTACESEAVAFIKEQLEKDVEALDKDGDVSLLAKWLPSVNTSNDAAVRAGKKLAKLLGMSESKYRKTLSALRAQIKIIENNLREKKYDFDYEKQPSKALFKYRQAFIRNDNDRYTDYLDRVSKGEAKMNTGTLMPYELVESVLNKLTAMSEEEKTAVNTTWEKLEDFGGDENILAVIDGSGSMYAWKAPTPASVALSLGLYFAERNKGAFKNNFITFSANPKLVEIKGKDIVEKVQYCIGFNECSNTNIGRTFDLILNTALKNRLKQSDMPSRLIIISDMEFDVCAEDSSMTNFEAAKAKFARYGYTLPQLVFWNVNSFNRQQPVRKNEQGVTLVSGMSPQIFAMLKDDRMDPYTFMMSVIGAERYKQIVA